MDRFATGRNIAAGAAGVVTGSHMEATMRSLIKSTLVLCLTLFAAAALAQPKAIRRPGVPPPPPSHNPPPPPPGAMVPVAPAANMAMVCSQQRVILAQEQDRLDDARQQLAGIDAELAQLRRRMDDLNRQRPGVQSQVSYYDPRVRKFNDDYRRQCAKDESCTQYDTLATQLDQQGNAVQGQLNNVRTQMDTYRPQIQNLDSQIQPLRTEYMNLQCNNMIPGSTAQQTIDRCMWIFSEWNRLQAQLNSMNGNLPTLKSQYDQLLAQLRSIEARAKDYDVYMSRNCTTSAKYQSVQNYGRGGVRQNAENMGGELDRMIQDVARLKGVQISVTTR
jgi:chromosome segregation ATPase